MRESFQTEHCFALFRDWSSFYPTPRFCFSLLRVIWFSLTHTRNGGRLCNTVWGWSYHSWKNCQPDTKCQLMMSQGWAPQYQRSLCWILNKGVWCKQDSRAGKWHKKTTVTSSSEDMAFAKIGWNVYARQELEDSYQDVLCSRSRCGNMWGLGNSLSYPP